MKKNTSFVDEFYALIGEILYDDNKVETADTDQLAQEIDRLAKHQKIQYRFTVLMLGIFCDDARQRVNSWLINQNFEHLTHRDPVDALFLYAYEAFKNVPLHKRLPQFLNYLEEYLAWTRDRVTPNPVSSPKNLYSDIVTFGQLSETVRLNSVVIENEDNDILETLSETGKRAMNTLSVFIQNRKSLTDFLNYLDNDKATQAYNQRGTYYVQKMLYNIMKFSIDMLFERNLPRNPETAEAYKAAKNAALHDRSKDGEVFHRFVKHNRLFLKGADIKKFRQWLHNNEGKETFNINECLKWLDDKEIAYQSLFTNLFFFFMGDNYSNIMSEMQEGGKQAGYSALNLSEKVYAAIWGGDAYIRTRMIRVIRDIISGNIYASRTFLVLFGTYAGYDEEQLDHVLARNDFARLSAQNSFDEFILAQLDQNIAKQLRDTINTKAFISKIGSYDDEWGIEIGRKEREQYNDIVIDFASLFNDFLNKADHEFLTTIFEDEKIKKLLKKSENELKEANNKLR